jgi:branched-chain amino acid transport system permease protein
MLEAGFGFTAALIGAVLGAALVAAPVEIALLRPIYGHPNPLTQVVLTIGIAFVIIGLLNLGFGPSVKDIATPDWMSGPVDIGFRNVAGHRLAVIGAGLGIALALKLLIDHTGFGMRVRAIAENPDMAAALGIRTQVVRSAAFALGVGLAALGCGAGGGLLPHRALLCLTPHGDLSGCGLAGGLGLDLAHACRGSGARRGRYGWTLCRP